MQNGVFARLLMNELIIGAGSGVEVRGMCQTPHLPLLVSTASIASTHLSEVNTFDVGHMLNFLKYVALLRLLLLS